MSHAATLSVIIVDDEGPARARLRDLLADIAHELPNEIVAEADNGLRALAAIDGGGRLGLMPCSFIIVCARETSVLVRDVQSVR